MLVVVTCLAACYYWSELVGVNCDNYYTYKGLHFGHMLNVDTLLKFDIFESTIQPSYT